jgi:hypothetical protein
MNGNVNHLAGLLRRLLAHFRQHGYGRSRRMYDRKGEWIRQVHEAPTLAETMQWRALDDLARRRARQRGAHRRLDGPGGGRSGPAYAPSS